MAENRITRQTRHVVRCYVVRDSALPIFGRIPCLETTKTRIQFCANAILPKSRTAGPGRPVSCSCLFDGICSPPHQLFSGWHCDPGSQSDNGRHAKLEISQRPPARSICFGPPCGARSRGPARRFFPPHVFYVTRPDWSAFNVSTAAGPNSMPSFRAQNTTTWVRRRALPRLMFKRCTGLAPQIPPGPRPTSERQTGSLLRASDVGDVEWLTRTLWGHCA
jgi:hypothetical protein